MTNANHDNMEPEYIKPPARMPVAEWDKLEIETKGKTNASTKK